MGAFIDYMLCKSFDNLKEGTMKTYNVSLARSYIVTIKAEDEEKARDYAEFFIGDCYDVSTSEDRQKHNFKIDEIEPAINDAIDIEEIKE